jgi:hypothetical protein
MSCHVPRSGSTRAQNEKQHASPWLDSALLKLRLLLMQYEDDDDDGDDDDDDDNAGDGCFAQVVRSGV